MFGYSNQQYIMLVNEIERKKKKELVEIIFII
jgi:hypothetical protein